MQRPQLRYVGQRSGVVVLPDEVIVAAGSRPATDFLRQTTETDSLLSLETEGDFPHPETDSLRGAETNQPKQPKRQKQPKQTPIAATTHVESKPPLLVVPLDTGGGIQVDPDTLRVDCSIAEAAAGGAGKEERRRDLQVGFPRASTDP
jgi:hypothetical protein